MPGDVTAWTGAGIGVLAFLVALWRCSAAVWRGLRRVQEAVDHVALVPRIHDDLTTLRGDVSDLRSDVGAIALEQKRVDGELVAHMADEKSRAGATDARLGSIESDIRKIAGWQPPPAEAG